MDEQSGEVAVVIPARDEAARIGATVAAAAAIPSVDLVVVVDDGSCDRTGRLAEAAGAVVVRHQRNRGKAAAMETGAQAVSAIEQREVTANSTRVSRALLFLDADLEATAANAAPLVQPVLATKADATIAVLPTQRQAGGGHGFVVRLSRDGIVRATGYRARQPLSGQRCLTREAYQAALPLAAGFGVETGMTIDLLRRGFTLEEVEVDLHHRVTGTDLSAQMHRVRQYRDVARALLSRKIAPWSLRRAPGA